MATTGSQISATVSTDAAIHITLPISAMHDRNNFLTWKSELEPIINGFGLTGYLDGSKPAPSAISVASNGVSQPNPEYLLWQKQDQLLLGGLRSSIKEAVVAQFVNCSTAGDLWRSLHQVYSAVSRAKITKLRRQLQTMVRGSQSCADYFEKMKGIADQLTAIGSPISDPDIVSFILNGLGPEYNSYVVVINTRSAPVSVSDLQGFVLSHEALLTAQLAHSSSQKKGKKGKK